MKSYTIHYDRRLLLVKGSCLLTVTLVVLTLITILPLNPFLIFLALTVCWFTGKAGGRALLRLVKHKPLCVIRERELEIAMPSGEGKIMKIKDISRMERKDTGSRIQLVLHGSHVEHPSGAYLIDIHYPFAKQQLLTVSDELHTWINKQKIEVTVIQKGKKEVQVSV